jgi:hypothetical protein
MGFFTRKLLNLILIMFLIFCLLDVAEKAYADPPPPPVNPVTIDPNPFDPYEKTDQNYTTLSYFLYSDTLLWLRIYDSSGVLTKILETPPNGYTVDPVYGIAGDHSIDWDGSKDPSGKVPQVFDPDTAIYPYHWDDIIYERSTANTGRQVYDVVVDPNTDPTSSSQVMWMTDTSGLWKSTDSGNSWTDMTGLLTNSTGPHFGIAISNDGQKIFVIDSGSNSLHYSIDGGNTWFNTSLWASPSNPLDIACSSDGSVLYGVDRGTKMVYRGTFSCPGGCTVTWGAGVRPLGNAQAPTGVAVDPDNSNNILVADNGTVGGVYRVYRSTTAGSTFTTVYNSATYDPYQMSIDSNGHYWVSILGSHAVYQLIPKPTSPDEIIMTVGGSAGDGDYQFKSGGNRLGIFVSSYNGRQYLYVASWNHYSIKVYSYDNIESDNVFQNEPDDPIVVAQVDLIPPGQITDLSTNVLGYYNDSGTLKCCAIELSWTAPGDDGYTPNTRARSYDIRYSKESITKDNWDSSTVIQATGEPTPSKCCTHTDTFTLTGLESNTTYYFAIKAKDEYNLSDLPDPPDPPSVLAKTGLLWEWNMISCPLQPDNDSSASVFGNNAGIDWVWDWFSTWSGVGDPDDPDYDGYWYQVFTIDPGKGLILLSYNTQTPTDAAGDDIIDASRTFHLTAGWNLIGNPYGTSVNLSDCDVTYDTSTENYLNVDTMNCSSGCTPGNWIGNAVYIWNGSDYDFATGDVDHAQLEPWKGYWILACCNLDLIIYKP